jgi:alkylated DNA nucleotide flippase Atl1
MGLAILDNSRSIKSILSRRQNRGKETPKWAVIEYRRKITLSKKDLQRNKIEISELIKLINSYVGEAVTKDLSDLVH